MFNIGDEVEVVRIPGYKLYEGILGKRTKISGYGSSARVYKGYTLEDYGWIVFAEGELKPLSPKPFTKDDLRDHDEVTLRNGETAIIWKEHLLLSTFYNDEEITIDIHIGNIHDDLTIGYKSYKQKGLYDIMTVTRNGKVVYQREKTIYKLIE